ncbi:alpha/beta hydrolase family protein [Streptomyces sp. NBC_00237]|uniref:alpha/beta hydrolase n=1 Tax=Streptomyces sp. NBC_00237 TaxID=2975687 RepID=UPI00224F03C0|nr:alpha/beta hydrolase [Streptomyces sp. NBC_00237]MCX5201415.1 alpha/beta hydrolase family protein [Streptomyces sp. NBC_00237]
MQRSHRFRRTLTAVALVAAMVGGTAGWVSADSQTPVTGPPPGSAAWRSAGLIDPARSTASEVAAFFRGLSEERRDELVRRYPLVVGNLDGAPVALRYAANRVALAQDGRFGRLLSADRQILAFDPRGRGQVAEVYGDLGRARHVAVIVPGSDMDAGTYDREKDPYGTPAGMAGSLRAATGSGTAVVAWVGYTTPVGVGVDAATGSLAEAGAERLARFAEGLDAVGAPDPAVFCHSYGSVVCGLAAPRLDAADIVAFASPGMRVGSAAELGARGRVWAAKDPTDWIDKVPHVEVFGVGHGADPAAAPFGARRVPAEGARGHTGYFAPGTDSLRAFAAIAEGRAG